MSDPEHRDDGDPAEWSDPRAAYDLVAEAYVERFGRELDDKPFDREILTRFAQAAGPRATPKTPVCDLGCGPGHIGAFVAALGVEVIGIDLSPGMVDAARRLFPAQEFAVGDMTALDRPDASLAGIVCFYSLIHVPRSRALLALREMQRTVVPDGDLLLAVHGGQGSLHADEMVSQPVTLDATLFTLDELDGLLAAAGFTVRERHERQPIEGQLATPRLYVWATAQA
jgi:SAM-dependent methyltransferase